VLQQVRATKPNANGTATITVGGNTVTVDPNAVLDQGKADGTYSTFGAIFDVSGAFGDAGNGSVPAAQTSIQTVRFELRRYVRAGLRGCVRADDGIFRIGFERSDVN
jgi:hypothetical protein